MQANKIQHLNWDDVELESVNPSMRRQIVTGALMTVARIWFKNGFLVRQHSHNQEQITQVASGKMRFYLGTQRNEVVDVGPGEVIVIPPNLPHEALCIGDVEEIDMWSPRRDDWLNKTDDYLRDTSDGNLRHP
jgi:quercetin dioxygenase-like cupin family protein